MSYSASLICLAVTGALGAAPSTGAPQPGKVELAHQQPSRALTARSAHVSLETLLTELSEQQPEKLRAEAALKEKRVHVFGAGFSRAELKQAVADLTFAKWRRERAGLTLKVDEKAARTARDLRERYPEYAPASDPEHDRRAAFAAEILGAVRSEEAMKRLDAANPTLASSLKDPMLGAAVSAVGPLLAYEVYLLAGPGLRVSGDRITPAARDRMLQAAGSGVQSVSAVNLRLNGGALGVILEFKNLEGGSVVQSRFLPTGPTRRPSRPPAEAAPREAPKGNLRLPDRRIDPLDVIGAPGQVGRPEDWSVTLERLARVSGLKLVSDVHFRPPRPGEYLLSPREPFRVWRVPPGETVPLAEFIPALAEVRGFTLQRSGDVLLFRHRQYYWEHLYRYPDSLLNEAAAVETEERRSLDYVERFLDRPPKMMEGLSELFPEFTWISSNPDGARLYASLAPEQRLRARAAGLPFRELTPPQRQAFWRWQRVPPALAPFEPRQPLKLQVVGGSTGESLSPAPDAVGAARDATGSITG